MAMGCWEVGLEYLEPIVGERLLRIPRMMTSFSVDDSCTDYVRVSCEIRAATVGKRVIE